MSTGLNPLSHEYACQTVLCESSKWSVDQVFHLMLTSTKFIAPTDQDRPVVNGMIVMVNVFRKKNNPIAVTIAPALHSVTNRTLHGHILYPGSVTRTVKQHGGTIVMDTQGVGSGLIQGSLNILNTSNPINQFLPPKYTPGGAANNLAAAFVWGAVDRLLKARIEALHHPPA